MARIIAACLITVTAVSAIIVGIVAARSAQVDQTTSWREIARGVAYRTMEVREAGATITAHALRLDLSKARLRVLDAGDLGMKRASPEQSRRATARQFAEKTGAMAAINGGFFDEDGKALGLVISDGKEKSRWLRRQWGIFLLRGKQPSIIHADDYRARPERSRRADSRITQALEVGPRLVVAGKILQFKPQSARRSAIGIQRSRGREHVILFASEDSLSLKRLAEVFAAPENKGGLGCSDALHLDSGRSTQFFIRAGNVEVNLPGGWAVPNGIGVFEK